MIPSPYYRSDAEVCPLECIMPSLSSLLENPRISETDSFVICIQIHSPAGPQYPQHPSAYYVPRDLLDGVEASLDNPRKSQSSRVEPYSATWPPDTGAMQFHLNEQPVVLIMTRRREIYLFGAALTVFKPWLTAADTCQPS